MHFELSYSSEVQHYFVPNQPRAVGDFLTGDLCWWDALKPMEYTKHLVFLPFLGLRCPNWDDNGREAQLCRFPAGVLQKDGPVWILLTYKSGLPAVFIGGQVHGCGITPHRGCTARFDLLRCIRNVFQVQGEYKSAALACPWAPL